VKIRILKFILGEKKNLKIYFGKVFALQTAIMTRISASISKETRKGTS